MAQDLSFFKTALISIQDVSDWSSLFAKQASSRRSSSAILEEVPIVTWEFRWPNSTILQCGCVFVSRAGFLDPSFPLFFFLIPTFVAQFSWNFGWLKTCVSSLLPALQKEKCEKERGARQRHACLPRAPRSAPFWDLTTRQQRRKWKRRWKIWNFFALIPSRPVTWSMEIRLGDGLLVGTEGGDRVRVQR